MAQDLGGLGVGQILEMPQRDDLAVDRVHAVEHVLELELTSARMAAWLAVVNRPSSWAASETELACGKRPRYSDTSRPASRMAAPEVLAMDPHEPLPGHQS